MVPKLNLKGVILLIEELNSKVLTNFISNISVINSSDILFSFSFYKKEKMIVSLNHNSPFISLIDSSYNSNTVMGSLNENLRKYIRGSYITKIEQINSDRVIKFSLTRTNEFYQKDVFYMVLELIPTVNNLIILNENEEVIFAKHYLDLTASRPILKGMKYIPVEPNSSLVIKDFNMDNHKNNVSHYLNEIDQKAKKEKSLPLFNFLKQKSKSLKKKIGVLEKEIEEAKLKKEYKEIGETLLTLKDDQGELNNYLDFIKDSYDTSKSVMDNINHYFDIYKKSKRTIENDLREIDIAKNSEEEIEHILSLFPYYSEAEIEELYLKYLPKKHVSKSNKKVDARLPYYISYKGTRIGFGKNKEQNNYLTFKLANKTDIFMHASNVSGAHVVIFNQDPSKEVIQLASEIALLLSNLESGDIYIADVKDVKKSEKLGQVNLLKYQTITLHEVSDNAKQILKEQKRFS